MNLLKFLFGGGAHTAQATPGTDSSMNPGDDGATVDGKPTYEYAQSHKNDLAMMLRCCDAELQAMRRTHMSPAPAYFERVAIIYGQQSDYAKEIEVCEFYLAELDRFLAHPQHNSQMSTREGGGAQRLRERIARAKALQAKP